MKPDPAPQGGGATGLPEIIAEGRRLEAEATQGPWKLWGMSVMSDPENTSDVDKCTRVAQTGYRNDEGKLRTNDAAFIAFARNHFKTLLDAAEAPNAHAELLEALREILGAYEECERLFSVPEDDRDLEAIARNVTREIRAEDKARAALNRATRQPGKTEDL